MPQDNIAIARTSYNAYVTKNRASLEALIADDFHFTSPLDNRLDRATYFERCWPNSQNHEHFDYLNLVPLGDRVFVTYIGTTKDGHRFQNSEIMTIRHGKIVDVEVYFGWSIPHKAKPGSFLQGEIT